MIKINIGGIDDFDTIDTEGIAYGIFFQGCRKRCKGCHNPELWHFNEGVDYSLEELLEPVKDNIDWYDSVAIMGGEPLEQREALIELLKEADALELETWVYTGYSVDEIPADIVRLCSVIVAGEYKEDLKTGGFPATSNQVVIDRRH